jgi:flagellar biogenesis protein FliO
MGLAAFVACIALAAAGQDPAVGPAPSVESGAVTVTLPPALPSRVAADPAPISVEAKEARQPEPLKAAAAAPIPVEEPRRVSRPLEEKPEAGPSVGGFVVGSFAVVGFLGGAFLLLRRFGKNSRLLGNAGPIKVLARKALGQKQEIFLVEVGAKVFMIGSTKDHLSTLGEISAPDEVAVLRANLSDRREDSHRVEFNQSLREGIREEEGSPSDASAKGGPREERVFASIADELAEIRKTVRAWRA